MTESSQVSLQSIDASIARRKSIVAQQERAAHEALEQAADVLLALADRADEIRESLSIRLTTRVAAIRRLGHEIQSETDKSGTWPPRWKTAEVTNRSSVFYVSEEMKQYVAIEDLVARATVRLIEARSQVDSCSQPDSELTELERRRDSLIGRFGQSPPHPVVHPPPVSKSPAIDAWIDELPEFHGTSRRTGRKSRFCLMCAVDLPAPRKQFCSRTCQASYLAAFGSATMPRKDADEEED